MPKKLHNLNSGGGGVIKKEGHAQEGELCFYRRRKRVRHARTNSSDVVLEAFWRRNMTSGALVLASIPLFHDETEDSVMQVQPSPSRFRAHTLHGLLFCPLPPWLRLSSTHTRNADVWSSNCPNEEPCRPR